MLPAAIALLLLAGSAFAQKVKVDHDKGTDFSKFKTYTLLPPGPTSRPQLQAYIIESIQHYLDAKGLKQVDKGGDLTVAVNGSLAAESSFGASTPIIPTYSGPPPGLDSTMWTGAGAPISTQNFSQGTLIVDLIEASKQKLIWRATGSAKFDPDKKKEALNKIDKTILKMFSEYPPKN
jgi:hypothetical protein